MTEYKKINKNRKIFEKLKNLAKNLAIILLAIAVCIILSIIIMQYFYIDSIIIQLKK